MAKDDYYVIVYKIPAYLYMCLKRRNDFFYGKIETGNRYADDLVSERQR